MPTTEIGISTYEITIANCAPLTWSGKPDELWPFITDKLNAAIRTGQAPEGTIPDVRKLDGEQPQAPQVTERTHTGDGEDDDTRLARVEEDRQKLAALGFSLGTPFFDRGVAGVGTGGKVRRSATEHEAKPKVPVAVAAFRDAIRSEERQDIVLPTTQLVMRSDGTVAGKDGNVWSLEPHAMKQLATRLGIMHPGALEEVWPQLRASFWNQHIATAAGLVQSTCPEGHPVRERLAPIAERDTMCRTRLDDSGSRTIYAAVGPSFGVFDVDQIASELEEGMARYSDARCEIQYDGRRAQFDVLFHSDVKPEHYSAGEVFRVGIRVRAGDGGDRSIVIGLTASQSLCTNMMMVSQGAFKLDSIAHRGSSERMAERFDAAMAKAQGQIGHFLERWGYACAETLAEVRDGGMLPGNLRLLDEMPDDNPISETDMLLGIFQGIRKQGAVSLSKGDMPGLLRAHALDTSGAVQCAPITRASIVNAITRHAHEHVGRVSPLRQQDLEAQAGNLLVSGRGNNPQPLPFLPPQRERVAA